MEALLDPQTLLYLGYSIAAIATIGMGYYASKNGISALDLQPEDC